jgi:hypothetical protein
MLVQFENAVLSKKLSLRLSSLCVGASVFTASTIGFFINLPTVQAGETVKRPTIATVKSMTNGDIMCYVTLVDKKGKKYKEVGANFEICESEKTFLNKKVRLSYGKVKVNDCQSAEPCGKTRLATLITKMSLVK